jgi:hypothetical protein
MPNTESTLRTPEGVSLHVTGRSPELFLRIVTPSEGGPEWQEEWADLIATVRRPARSGSLRRAG